MAKPKVYMHIPGLPQRSYEYRRGDSIAVYNDKKQVYLIDGGEPELFAKMEKFLEKNLMQKDGWVHVTFILTHWHGDHDCGLKAALNSGIIKVDEIICPPPEELKLVPRDDGYAEYNRAVKIIDLAKSKNKKIVYPPAGKVTGYPRGGIRMTIYRQKANPKDFVDYQVNNTSLQVYFPDLQHLEGGDMITAAKLKVLRKYPKRIITSFGIDHHGNSCTYETCDEFTKLGAKICYYSDWEPKGVSIGGTTFSKYGAYRAKQYFNVLRPFADIDVTADGCGHVTWKQSGKSWTYDVKYGKGESPTPAKKDPEPEISVHSNPGFKGYNVTKRTEEIKYIVIHYVGAESTAEANVKYFNAANRNASADYFVGHDGGIWQYNPSIKSQYSWHCGGSIESSHHPLHGICKNGNSIGIELCTNKSGDNWTFSSKTVESAVLLTKYLMKTYNIPVAHVVRHYDVTGKACPRVPGWGAVGGSAEWDKFKSKLTGSAQIYRVRKSWADTASQLGAFSSLDNARAMAAKHPGWKIFDASGNEVK